MALTCRAELRVLNSYNQLGPTRHSSRGEYSLGAPWSVCVPTQQGRAYLLCLVMNISLFFFFFPGFVEMSCQMISLAQVIYLYSLWLKKISPNRLFSLLSNNKMSKDSISASWPSCYSKLPACFFINTVTFK